MSKTIIRLSCFYGEALPGALVELDAEEAARLVSLGAGKVVAVGSAEQPAQARKRSAKSGVTPESDAASETEQGETGEAQG